MRVLKHHWFPLIMVWVITFACFTVDRKTTLFDDERDPTVASANSPRIATSVEDVVYEVVGPAGAIVLIDYLDEHAVATRVGIAILPWRHEMLTTSTRAAITVTEERST
jgi:hypothetical protein